MAAPLLTLRGLSKSYGASAVLAGIDLAVAPGEILALVGENGAGKSTLMRIVGGGIKPAIGEVSFDGVVGAMAEAEACEPSCITLSCRIGLGDLELIDMRRRVMAVVDEPTAPAGLKSGEASHALDGAAHRE